MINYLLKINYLSIKLIICQNKVITDQKMIDYVTKLSQIYYLRSLGYIFVADSIWVALQVFQQFCPKSRRRESISCRARNRF